jgi:hypothetical protein
METSMEEAGTEKENFNAFLNNIRSLDSNWQKNVNDFDDIYMLIKSGLESVSALKLNSDKQEKTINKLNIDIGILKNTEENQLLRISELESEVSRLTGIMEAVIQPPDGANEISATSGDHVHGDGFAI